MSEHDITDPITIASVLVRDHLDTVIQRHGSVKDDAVSAAVHQLATALLGHLPGEAKQARADRTTDDDLTRSVKPDPFPSPQHAPADKAHS